MVITVITFSVKTVFINIIITLTVTLCQKDNDEGRPYEFGFTIDGQQHRHEKKDQNGIIQGEFGFITADGVYHVTVYATDENGNFHILSMKNIRISAPLDGSPALGPISPDAGKYLGKQHPPAQSVQQKPIIQQQSVTETLKRYEFTTQSTIKPACAGCGYVTTAKPIPGQPFQFQNPKFQNPISSQKESGLTDNKQNFLPNSGKPIASTSFQTQNQPSDIYRSKIDTLNGNGFKPGAKLDSEPGYSPLDVELLPPGSDNPGQLPNNQGIQTYATQKTNSQIQQTGFQNNIQSSGSVPIIPRLNSFQQPNRNFENRNGFGVTNIPSEPRQLSPGVEFSSPVSGAFGDKPSIQNYGSQQQGGFNQHGSVQVRPGPNLDPSSPFFGTINPNTAAPQNQVSTLPPISVSENVIHIGGKNPQDISIQDKYPGMIDGLPNGVEETDVKDILYKFKYTVGFHGHYEKGLKTGAKIGGYFVNGRDGISRVVTYIADENGYRPKFKFINLGLESPDTPKEETEKTFGLKSFEFVWYPIE